ncbi:MAG: hypothetical protein M3P93_03340 [Actinomycetota bacterium]|nr:hypothetical protein [Actinomycetota bacterium]
MLGYWRREWNAHLAPLLVRCAADEDDLLVDPEALAGLRFLELQERHKKG